MAKTEDQLRRMFIERVGGVEAVNVDPMTVRTRTAPRLRQRRAAYTCGAIAAAVGVTLFVPRVVQLASGGHAEQLAVALPGGAVTTVTPPSDGLTASTACGGSPGELAVTLNEHWVSGVTCTGNNAVRSFVVKPSDYGAFGLHVGHAVQLSVHATKFVQAAWSVTLHPGIAATPAQPVPAPTTLGPTLANSSASTAGSKLPTPNGASDVQMPVRQAFSIVVECYGPGQITYSAGSTISSMVDCSNMFGEPTMDVEQISSDRIAALSNATLTVHADGFTSDLWRVSVIPK